MVHSTEGSLRTHFLMETVLSLQPLELTIQESGKREFLMEEEERNFLMVTVMKVLLKMVWNQVKEYLDGKMEGFTKDSLRMEWWMGEVNSTDLISNFLRDSLRIIKRKEEISWRHNMELIQDSLKMEKLLDREHLNGMIKHYTKENSRMDCQMVMELSRCQKVKLWLDIGRKVKTRTLEM